MNDVLIIGWMCLKCLGSRSVKYFIDKKKSKVWILKSNEVYIELLKAGYRLKKRSKVWMENSTACFAKTRR